ncbi:hypothetical protein BVRB_1g015640 [Beta vulgaris subsp. vulgaris]|nr:hypothetical protein BVRB_1g015640 [Beta vulgaris subsp. vulgaris]
MVLNFNSRVKNRDLKLKAPRNEIGSLKDIRFILPIQSPLS